ncbi:MAG: hypothetical protein HQM08_10935 [Candidatus Riflebacteria bacterium]|nr:hypothetical protein [Candidatus Riflebacteria bacterium]
MKEFNRKKAISLLEILVALFILVMAGMALFQSFRGSGIRGETFSSEHFTAMFICQKVIEDIDYRLSENPHFFTELIHISAGEKKKIVNGDSFLFSIWQNTKNNGFLDQTEDGSIDGNSGKIYTQLKNFQLQVSSNFVTNLPAGSGGSSGSNSSEPLPGLSELTITVTWTDSGGKDQKYSVNHILTGYNEDNPNKAKSNIEVPFPNDEIGKALFSVASMTVPSANAFSEFMKINGGDESIARNLGALALGVQSVLTISNLANAKIAELEQERDAALSSGSNSDKEKAAIVQLRIAEKYGEKASMVFLALARTNPYIQNLSSVALPDNLLGTILSYSTYHLRVVCTVGAAEIAFMKTNFEQAETEYQKALTAPYSDFLPARKVNPTIKSLLDIKKMKILYDSAPPLNANASFQDLNNSISSLLDKFRGKEPYFYDFLTKEKEIAASITTIRAYFGESGGLTTLMDELNQFPNKFDAIEKALR